MTNYLEKYKFVSWIKHLLIKLYLPNG